MTSQQWAFFFAFLYVTAGLSFLLFFFDRVVRAIQTRADALKVQSHKKKIRKRRFHQLLKRLRSRSIKPKGPRKIAGAIRYKGMNYASVKDASALLGIPERSIVQYLNQHSALGVQDTPWNRFDLSDTPKQYRPVSIGRLRNTKLIIADYRNGVSKAFIKMKGERMVPLETEVQSGSFGDKRLQFEAKKFVESQSNLT